MTLPGYIPVVAAVVVREGRLLLCQRPEGPHLPLLWEFPGGKVDPGEDATGALVRELAEELGVAATVGGLFHEVRHDYPEKRVWIRFYSAVLHGDPRPRVHRQLRWIVAGDLEEFPAPPPNAEVIGRLRREGLDALPAVPLSGDHSLH